MKTVLFSNSTPKICINRDFEYPKICINRVFDYPEICIILDFDLCIISIFQYPKICITLERDGKINRLICFDKWGSGCLAHAIFDYSGANFEPYPLSFLNFYGIMAVTNVVF